MACSLFRPGIAPTGLYSCISVRATNNASAMLEQSIYKTMLDIVRADFPNSSNYRDAVAEFRLPYWDPYRPRGGRVTFPGAGGTTTFPYDFKLPQIMTLQSVMVLSKETDRGLTSIRNPLQSFVYPRDGSFPREQWAWVQDAYQGSGRLPLRIQIRDYSNHYFAVLRSCYDTPSKCRRRQRYCRNEPRS